MKKNKQLQAVMFSAIGVAVMFLVIVAVNVIAGTVKTRVDLTEDKIYTLSPGTKAILAKLDTPVEIRFYYTKNDNAMPVRYKSYAQRVEDLLYEYKQGAKGKIEIKKFNPEPDSDAEDSANLDGMLGQPTPTGDKIYLGLAISMLDTKVAIPFLSDEREKLLEYDISRAITRVTAPAKPIIGVMSSLQVFGEFNPMMMRMGRATRGEPWVFISELQRDFEVKQIQMDVEKIDDEIKVLLVVHPKAISDKAQFAIDQFVLRGGKLVAFLDPLSIVDAQSNPQANPLQAAASGGSTLDKLLKAWGLEFDVNKVVADMNYVTRISRGGQPEAAPAVLSMTEEAVNTNDVVTSQVDHLLIPFAGVFTGTPAEGLKQTVLLKTTKDSQMIEKFMAQFSGEQISKDFVASGKEYPIAVRLTGKFKTAYPDGKPKDAAKPGDDKSDDKQKDAQKDTPGDSLKASTTDGAVVLVGDADFLADSFSVQVQEFFGQRIIVPRNQNLNLVQNVAEQLSGDSNLISLRSRATMNRPFTVVKKMQNRAEERYRSKLKELEKSLQETQNRLQELEKNKGSGQRFILSPEQQAEVGNFRKKEAEMKKELKRVKRNLNQEIDALENQLKWVNIAGMPFLVTISGISLALLKRKQTAAK